MEELEEKHQTLRKDQELD